MTSLGKIFVMVNLVLSLMMATVGMGLYASSIDWTERAAKGTEPPGVTAQRKAALKEAMDGVPAVDAGWRDANEAVMAREEQRQADQVWHAGELEHVRLKANAAAPARDIDIQENGIPKADPKVPGRPLRIAAEDRNKKPLQGIAAYEGLVQKALAEHATQLELLRKEFDADIQLTNKMTPPKGEKGGLRDRLVSERVKREGIVEETEQVEHLGTKAAVEAAVIGERIEMLDAQIASLRRALSRLKGLDGGK